MWTFWKYCQLSAPLLFYERKTKCLYGNLWIYTTSVWKRKTHHNKKMNSSSCKFKNLLWGREDLLNLSSLVYTSLLSTHHMIEVSHFSTPSFVFPRNALYVYLRHNVFAYWHLHPHCHTEKIIIHNISTLVVENFIYNLCILSFGQYKLPKFVLPVMLYI